MEFVVEMRMLICVLLPLFGRVNFVLATGSLQPDTFQSVSFSNPVYEMVLKATSVNETSQKSKLWCAISCGRNVRCNFAVFRESETWCKHVYNYTTNSPVALPGYTNDAGCYVLIRNNPRSCQNNGVYNRDIGACDCNSGYAGLECESIVFEFCQASNWRTPTNEEVVVYKSSRMKMKFSVHSSSQMQVYDALYLFVRDVGKFEFGSMSFLEVDISSETFRAPLRREFKFCSSYVDKLIAYHIDMAGQSDEASEDSPDCKLWIRDTFDSGQLYLQKDSVDPPTALIDGILRKGYRVLDRDFIRVGVDEGVGDVYFQNSRVGTSKGKFSSSEYLNTYRVGLKSGNITKAKTYLVGGIYEFATLTVSIPWELDRCWAKFSDGVTYQELTQTILSGQNLRIIEGSRFAWDITMVTVIPSDVVASMAPYYTPFDGTNPFRSDSRIRFSLISHSKTSSTCEMEIQQSAVHGFSTVSLGSTLEWVVSTRPWTKIFTVASGGVALYGDKMAVYNAAATLYDIRVCVERSAIITYCYGSVSVVMTGNGDVLFQTPAALGSKFNADGSFSGILDSNCRRYVWLVSTKGRVERAAYVLGQSDPPDAVVTEPFLTITWFSQA